MRKLLTTLLLLTISLFGRENPFEADMNKMKNENKTLMPMKIVVPMNNIDDGDRTVKIESHKTKIILKPIMKKNKIDKKAIMNKKDHLKSCKIKTEEKHKHYHKMMDKKKKEEFISAVYKVLPFVKIEVNKNDIIITSRTKYSIFNYLNLEEQKKVAFDFQANTIFYTKYKKLKSPKFIAYKVGNHKEENFFRVTIDLKFDTKKYKVSIKNNIARIEYKNNI